MPENIGPMPAKVSARDPATFSFTYPATKSNADLINMSVGPSERKTLAMMSETVAKAAEKMLIIELPVCMTWSFADSKKALKARLISPTEMASTAL